MSNQKSLEGIVTKNSFSTVKFSDEPFYYTPPVETMIDMTSKKLMTRNLSEKPLYFVFDTGAITKLYSQLGEKMFDKVEGEIIIPKSVLYELENQRDSKRRNDDGRLLCPWQLTNLIYTKEGEGTITVLEAAPTQKESDEIKYSMVSSVLNKKKNSRMSVADQAAVNLARTFDPDECVIVTEDVKDIGYSLSTLKLAGAGILKAVDYMKHLVTSCIKPPKQAVAYN